eukprot:GHVU01182830.1.p3 GENE.GHVU01182830.1~~GHVU01182830.1.p3  ORF type:complete len:193 (-),score=52.68 GHVU01182830.1:650-1228(-)
MDLLCPSSGPAQSKRWRQTLEEKRAAFGIDTAPGDDPQVREEAGEKGPAGGGDPKETKKRKRKKEEAGGGRGNTEKNEEKRTIANEGEKEEKEREDSGEAGRRESGSIGLGGVAKDRVEDGLVDNGEVGLLTASLVASSLQRTPPPRAHHRLHKETMTHTHDDDDETGEGGDSSNGSREEGRKGGRRGRGDQ